MDSRNRNRGSTGTVNHQTVFTAMGCECSEDTNVPVNVALSWSAEAPGEMLLTFVTRWQGRVVTTEWCTVIDLLIDGLYGPTGLGDLSIFPHLDDPRYVELILESPSHPHPVGFTAGRRVLWEFVAAVQAANSVTVGKES